MFGNVFELKASARGIIIIIKPASQSSMQRLFEVIVTGVDTLEIQSVPIESPLFLSSTPPLPANAATGTAAKSKLNGLVLYFIISMSNL